MKLYVIIVTVYLLTLINVTKITAELHQTEKIQTDKGQVRGLYFTTEIKNMTYAGYKGIPYAKPPVGKLRFQPPVENEPWQGVLDTTNTSSACPQWNDKEDKYTGDEDCLYLNVFTPKTNANDTELRAVMVWIYGGAFAVGYVNTSRYGPDFLLEENVVVVAMSYRLGPFGFLSLNHTNATGNAGLKDQILALRWVQKNIHNFGGDPNCVTIFGQSAGSVAVQLHKLSPLSNGLFHRSIAMSGSALNPWAISVMAQAVSRAYYLAIELGITSSDPDEILEELYKIPAEKIIETATRLVILDLPFKPTVEDASIATDPFLIDCPKLFYRNKSFSHEPHMLGFTNSEFVSFVGTPAAFVKGIKDALNSVTGITGINTIADFIRLRGLVNATIDSISDISYDLLDSAIRFTTDIFFIEGIDQVQRMMSSSENPIYYYRNSFDYPQAIHKVDGTRIKGTGHSDDIAHIFWVTKPVDQPTDPYSAISIQRKRMVRMWANMAKYGNPTPNGTNDPDLNITWPDSRSEGKCLEINHNYSIGERPIDATINILRLLVTPLRILGDTCPSSI